MNALAKVLIVVVLLLSAGFAVSQMILYGKREDFGRRYRDEVAAHRATDDSLKKAAGELQDKTRALDRVKNDLQNQLDVLTSDLADERARSRDLNTQGVTLTGIVEQHANKINSLDGVVAARQESIDSLEAEVVKRDGTIQANLDKIDSLQTNVAERDTSIDDLEHRLTESKQAYQIVAVNEERLEAIIEELLERDVHIPPAPLPIINGRVVRVNRELGVAVVDKGGAAGVKPNTQFTIYSDGTYVAKLVVHDVQSEVSAGRIKLLASGKQVEQGDQVTTEIPWAP